jgi:L-seryl-tRNA(Ser) seleniumtransferase
MKFPPFFKDLPNDAVKKVVELLNQPQLIQTVKDAAKQIGATTEWGATQVQDSMKQAKRWLDSVSQRWQANAPAAALPIINTTGYVFTDGIATQPADEAANAVYASSFAGSIDEKTLREEVERRLCEVTGAESAIVLHNVATAIAYTAMHRSCSDGLVVPRLCGVRLPDGGDVLDIVRSFGNLIEVGAVNSVSIDDLTSAMKSDRNVGLLALMPTSMESEAIEGSIEDVSLKIASESKRPYFEVRYDAMLCNRPESLRFGCALKQRIDSGVDAVIFPGDHLLSGPRCGIVVGKSNVIDSIRDSARRLGGHASTTIQAMLLGTIEANATIESWQASNAGETILCSIENQMHRAKRIASQMEASPLIASVSVTQQDWSLGSSLWSQIKLPTAVIEIIAKEQVDSLTAKIAASKRKVLTRPARPNLQFAMRSINPIDDRELVKLFVDEA